MSDPAPDSPASVSDMRRAATGWLSRREYSREEVRRKLQQRFPGADPEPVLAWLEEHRFLDENRYLDVFLRGALDRGHGPLRIRQTLQQKGISEAVVEGRLRALEVDWAALARELRFRRFGPPPPRGDRKAVARQLRFLQYRGFTAEQCYDALAVDPEEA